MKRTLTAIALALAATSVSAADLTIATGKTGGGYDAAALRAATKLGQRGHEVDVKNLNGSDEITLMLCRGEAQVGLTQIDAMDARAAEGCMLRPIATYGSGELAMIFFPPGSDYDELDDMGEGNAVLVDTIGSGTSLFWDTIVRIETGDYGNNSAWSKIKPVNDPISMAEPLAQFGDIDA
ncbi:MAG: hypothetical protein KI788_17075, partial [Mameliella sp.]|nr:hypothetical protein [Mameliella sp.]